VRESMGSNCNVGNESIVGTEFICKRQFQVKQQTYIGNIVKAQQPDRQ
jgi:hypothetical protein